MQQMNWWTITSLKNLIEIEIKCDSWDNNTKNPKPWIGTSVQQDELAWGEIHKTR